jgi:hypothetical protein
MRFAMQAVDRQEPIIAARASSDDTERAARSRAGEAKPRNRYASLWKVWLPIPIIFVLLDCTFNLWFWNIPRITGDADYGYQFQLDLHRLEDRKAPDAVRVLAFGSSVSGSFDPHQVEGLLNASQPTKPVQVHRLLRPGIKPADYRLLFQTEGDALRPDVAVITFNLLDFLNPSFERSFRSSIREALPPRAVLAEYQGSLPSTADKLDLLLASISNLYRYRKEIRTALSSHVREALRWARARPAHGPYGIYADGYTQQRFGMPLDRAGSVEFEYYIDPEWIRQRGTVELEFAVGGQSLEKRTETTPGWKIVKLDVPHGAKPVLDVEANSLWNPRAAGAADDFRLLAVRLRQPPPLSALDGNKPPYRYPPYEDGQIHPFLRMGAEVGDGFAAKWNEVLNSNTPFGVRFRAYRDSKLRVRDEVFAPTGEYAELERLISDLSKQGTFVLLVNTPESPWILNEYRPSPYYQAYLEFFRGLASKYDNVLFYDLSNALPAEDFNDWHHTNYIGSIKLGRPYADIVRAAINNLLRQRHQGA